MLLPILLSLAAVGAFLAYILTHDIAVLNPMGTIAQQQRDLIIFTTVLSLVVIVPVFVLTFFIVWRYREGGSKKAKYRPNWDGNRTLETIWWTIPCLIILVLAVVTWRTSHSLDPYRQLTADKPAVRVQVVALPWKWLFIYPDERVATVNYLAIPEDTPINFEITSDAPMNSFWIPQLGGQVYAMSGMTTKLHLSASEVGDYKGVSANLSGDGFAGMKFTAKAMTQGAYDRWVGQAQSSSFLLTGDEYDKLAKPSKNNKQATYSATQADLFDRIIMKYMAPAEGGAGTHTSDSRHETEGI